MTSQNPGERMFTMRQKWSLLYVYSIRQCIFKSVMLQKIRKNKDANHKYGHFLEIRTVIFSKMEYCKIRTNLTNKDQR